MTRHLSYALLSLFAFAAAQAATETTAVPEVLGLTLIDADSNEAIGELSDGMTLDFGVLGTRNLSVAANTRPERVGSVLFSLNDEAEFQLENLAPYAIAGDGDGGTDFYPWTPPLGSNILMVTPYRERNARGQPGRALSVRFTVVEGGRAGRAVLRAGPARPPTAPGLPDAPAAAPDTVAPDTVARTVAREAYATLRRPRFALTAQGERRGVALLTDYGAAGTTIAVFMEDSAAGEGYLAHLGVGGCGSGGAVLLPLASVQGESGLGATHTPLHHGGLVQGDFHVRVYRAEGELGEGELGVGELGAACGELGQGSH
jgi:hypothetical protein